MARILQCGFEPGLNTVSLYEQAGSAVATVSTTQARTGTYSLYCDANGDGAAWNFPSSVTEIYGRVAWYWIGYQPNYAFLTFYNSDREPMFMLRPIAGRLMRAVMWTGGAWATVATGTTYIPYNAWVCIEWHLKIADNPNGVIETKINGVADISFPSGDTLGDQTPASLSRVYVGANPSDNYPGESYFDDLAINDTAGSVNNSWVGRGGIQAIRPSGTGAHALWTPTGAANNWDCVEEVPPSTAEYVSSAVADTIDSYDCTNLTGTGTIAAVVPYVYAASAAAGATSVAPLYTIGGTHYERTTKPIDVSWVYISQIDEEDPSAAPGTAWTVDQVNAMELGVQCE